VSPAALALALIMFVASAGAASAHAVLLRATPPPGQSLPTAPTEVDLLFSESLDPSFSGLQVQDASGQRVDAGDSHVDASNDHLLVTSLRSGLANGVYTVLWRNVSAIDVHPDEGQFELFVGVPATASAGLAVAQNTATPETALGRWWFYIAASLFGGVLGTWKFVLAPFSSGDASRSRAQRLIIMGGVLLIVGTLYSALAQAASAANVSLWEGFGRPLSDLLLRGRFAAIWWPRIALEVASLFLVVFGGIEGLASECALATLPAVLLTSALTSHGAALPRGGLGIAIDWLHIVGATAWIGGLICLAASGAFPTRAVLDRFGRFALIASMAVLLSGVIQGALEVGSWSSVQTTVYGQLLLVKSGLLVAMLLLAAVNQLRAPAFGVRAELALGVIVFGVAAMLSGTPPPTPTI
jgi:copper transport protein